MQQASVYCVVEGTNLYGYDAMGIGHSLMGTEQQQRGSYRLRLSAVVN